MVAVVMSVSESKPPCDATPVCKMACPHGYQVDKNGCATCKCNKIRCRSGGPSLEGYFCGKGAANRNECSQSYKCETSPDGSDAVCCHVPTKYY